MDQETKDFFRKAGVVLKQIALAVNEVNPSTAAQVAIQDADDFEQATLRIKTGKDAD